MWYSSSGFFLQQCDRLYNVLEHHHCHSQHGSVHFSLVFLFWTSSISEQLKQWNNKMCLYHLLVPQTKLTPFLSLYLFNSINREVQLLRDQHCWPEQWKGWWRHLHRLHHERRSCGCRRPHRTWWHAAAGEEGFRLNPNKQTVFVNLSNDCLVEWYQWNTS